MWGLYLLGSPLEPEQRFKEFKEGMERAGRWRGTRLLCCLSPGNVLPMNEGNLQLQPFLSSFGQATPGTVLAHGACRWLIRKLGTDCLLAGPFFRLRDQNRQRCPVPGNLTLLLSTPALQAEWQWLLRVSETITFLLLPLLQNRHLLHRLGAPWSTEEEFLSMVEIDDFHPVRNWSTLSCKIRQTHTVNRNILKWVRKFVTYLGADKLDFWGSLYRSFSANKV